jgi:hypothetical protein
LPGVNPAQSSSLDRRRITIIVDNELPLTTHITASFGNGSPAVLARLLLSRDTTELIENSELHQFEKVHIDDVIDWREKMSGTERAVFLRVAQGFHHGERNVEAELPTLRVDAAGLPAPAAA